MTEERNREILKRRRAGETFAAIARDHSVSVPRVRQIFDREERLDLRRNELAEADRRADQPNLLHLDPWVRQLLAEFCGKAEFTPDDVERRGFWRSNFSCEEPVWRAIVKWMALAGKQPAKLPFRWTIEEWQEHDFGDVPKRP